MERILFDFLYLKKLYKRTFRNLQKLLFVFFLIIFFSCNKTSSYHYILNDAELFLETFPDSTLSLVKVLDDVQDLSKSDRALYNLLTAASIYKIGETQTDSIIAEALKYYESGNNMSRLLQSYYYIGGIMEDNKDVLSAQSYYLKAIDIGKNSDDFFILGRIYNHLGMLYTWQNMHEHSVPYLKNAIFFHRQANDVLGLTFSLRDLARTYSVLYESVDSALNYYKEALIISDDNIRVSMLSEIGSLYTKNGEYDKAYLYLQEALIKEPYSDDKNSTYIAYGALLLSTNKLDSARFYLNKALSSDDNRILQGAYYNLILTEKKAGNSAKVIDLLEPFWESLNKFEKEQYSETIANIESFYNYTNREKELSEIKFRQLRLNSFMLVCFVILFFICVLLIIRIYRNNKEIKKQKEKFENWKETYISRRDEGILLEQITHSVIFRKFHDEHFNPCSEDWIDLMVLIDKTYNNFTYNLKGLLPNISDLEIKISYLIKIGLQPGKISLLLNTSTQTVSMTRSRLYVKITGKKGTASKFDDLISKL